MELSQLFTYLILLTRKECSSKPHETPWLLLDSWSIKAYLPLLYSLSDAHQSEKDKERFCREKHFKTEMQVLTLTVNFDLGQ